MSRLRVFLAEANKSLYVQGQLVLQSETMFKKKKKKHQNQTNKQTVLDGPGDEAQLAEHMPSTCKISHLILSTKMLAGHCVEYP